MKPDPICVAALRPPAQSPSCSMSWPPAVIETRSPQRSPSKSPDLCDADRGREARSRLHLGTEAAGSVPGPEPEVPGAVDGEHVSSRIAVEIPAVQYLASGTPVHRDRLSGRVVQPTVARVEPGLTG